MAVVRSAEQEAGASAAVVQGQANRQAREEFGLG
jgi:hypothetical protein